MQVLTNNIHDNISNFILILSKVLEKARKLVSESQELDQEKSQANKPRADSSTVKLKNVIY